ncbi:OB-fold nucleic acid binding domain-containing protein [Iamia sp.]|uniref:OB-fold nucleic acid binding domain-containing protein n=1 Tax=Iamia sp. TaxID=2722710 RepID=UPI002CB56A0B|nr:OB-fold nucleic acid binding domain-containing protein [Iamia sp.]HXH57757.1 OB-fold nucleic acid binding domain-containing protein [Iamia sp.]
MLDSLRRRLKRTNEDLHAESLQARFTDASCSRIDEAADRGPVRIRGEVAGLQVVPRAGAPCLEVTVDDGTARAVAVFTGRTRVGGLDPGRPVAVEGMARRHGGRLVLLNPSYTLLP